MPSNFRWKGGSGRNFPHSFDIDLSATTNAFSHSLHLCISANDLLKLRKVVQEARRPIERVGIVPMIDGNVALVKRLHKSAIQRFSVPAAARMKPRRQRRMFACRVFAARLHWQTDCLCVGWELLAQAQEVDEVRVSIVQPELSPPRRRHETEARFLRAHLVKQQLRGRCWRRQRRFVQAPVGGLAHDGVQDDVGPHRQHLVELHPALHEGCNHAMHALEPGVARRPKPLPPQIIDIAEGHVQLNAAVGRPPGQPVMVKTRGIIMDHAHFAGAKQLPDATRVSRRVGRLLALAPLKLRRLAVALQSRIGVENNLEGVPGPLVRQHNGLL
mmetsp:Transcript_78185/g.203774  ORF Transcript_78185/g.203774 Transcript_78185/m.203774 type:complete len:329 (-) Transcript_78185:293-1279(-)